MSNIHRPRTYPGLHPRNMPTAGGSTRLIHQDATNHLNKSCPSRRFGSQKFEVRLGFALEASHKLQLAGRLPPRVREITCARWMSELKVPARTRPRHGDQCEPDVTCSGVRGAR